MQADIGMRIICISKGMGMSIHDTHRAISVCLNEFVFIRTSTAVWLGVGRCAKVQTHARARGKLVAIGTKVQLCTRT